MAALLNINAFIAAPSQNQTLPQGRLLTKRRSAQVSSARNSFIQSMNCANAGSCESRT
jgi:hypothetical protein